MFGAIGGYNMFGFDVTGGTFDHNDLYPGTVGEYLLWLDAKNYFTYNTVSNNVFHGTSTLAQPLDSNNSGGSPTITGNTATGNDFGGGGVFFFYGTGWGDGGGNYCDASISYPSGALPIVCN